MKNLPERLLAAAKQSRKAPEAPKESLSKDGKRKYTPPGDNDNAIKEAYKEYML